MKTQPVKKKPTEGQIAAKRRRAGKIRAATRRQGTLGVK